MILPQKITHSDPPASEITQSHAPASETHSQSCPCLRNTLTVIPLPQKHTHSHPPASETHSQPSPCLRESLTVIPLPQRITYSHPLAPRNLTRRGGGRDWGARGAEETSPWPPPVLLSRLREPCGRGGRDGTSRGGGRTWRTRFQTPGDGLAHAGAPGDGGGTQRPLTVIPLPHTASQGQSPVSHSHSASSPYVRNTLTVIPLPEKFTHSQPPASEIHSQSAPASENHLQSSPALEDDSQSFLCLRKSLTVILLP